MLTHEEISRAVVQVAATFPITRVSYFGSYADGAQTEASDLDLLLEFQKPAVSLFMLSAIKNDLEDLLKIPVDVIHAPLAKDSLIKIGKEVQVYGHP
jgi:predicted nucleotidyltransferase